MAYKRREFFIDDDFARLLTYFDETVEGPVELVLNGDVFDFDNVMQLPKSPPTRIDWLARLRGLSSEEWMSNFKIECIIRDHPTWFAALAAFINNGNRVVFVIGNHDLELNWPSVQAKVRSAIGSDDETVLRFCQWFYLSGGDTFISHGHQYDPNCAVPDPIDPLIEVNGHPRMRLPFGDNSARYMLNGMGFFNPHATENFIMTGWQYVRFFLRYALIAQPLLIWTWFWGAAVTLAITMRDHIHAPMRDPLLVEEKVAAIARRSNTTPAIVRRLRALDVAPASSRPWLLLRELWLDRGLFLLGILFAAWQLILHINIAVPISPWWVLAAIFFLLPPWFLYSSKVKSSVFAKPLLDERQAQIIADITGAERVVFGHTHAPQSISVGPVHQLNAGFWSPAFSEPECINRIGTQSFVWIARAPGAEVEAKLYEWPIGASAPRVLTPTTSKSPRRRQQEKKQTTTGDGGEFGGDVARGHGHAK